MSEVADCREEVVNEICMYMSSKGIDIQEAKNRLYIMLESYEIISRCTAVAELKEDRNEYLLKKFCIAKTVEGCTEKTIREYVTGISKSLRDIGKTVDDITTDDIRYYLAIRQTRDGISKRYADTVRRYLSTFFNYLWSEELIRKKTDAQDT